MTIQDKYWVSTGTEKWHVVKAHLANIVASRDFVNISFTSATALPRKVPIQFAKSVNPKLGIHLQTASSKQFLGTIVMDFPSHALCKLIIERNHPVLDVCRPVCMLPGQEAWVSEWIDDLQCEFQAAASQADAALLAHTDELCRHVKQLSRVYVMLVEERVGMQIRMPSVDDVANYDDENRIAKEATKDLGFTDKCSLPAHCEAHCAQCSSFGKESLDDIQCKLTVAASQADAAMLIGPHAANEQIANLSRVFAQLLVERAQIRCGELDADEDEAGRKDSCNDCMLDNNMDCDSPPHGRDPCRPFKFIEQHETWVHDWIEDLQCEFRAAASQADAAAFALPTVRTACLQQLAHVFVKLLTERVRIETHSSINTSRHGCALEGSSSQNNDDGILKRKSKKGLLSKLGSSFLKRASALL